MKVRALVDTYVGGAYRKEGSVFEFDGKELGSVLVPVPKDEPATTPLPPPPPRMAPVPPEDGSDLLS